MEVKGEDSKRFCGTELFCGASVGLCEFCSCPGSYIARSGNMPAHRRLDESR